MGDRFTGKEKTTDNEIVLDAAGCGTGRAAKIIADTVKKCKVHVVDTDDNTIANAKKTPRFFQTYSIHQIIFSGY